MPGAGSRRTQCDDPAAIEGNQTMKEGIHPDYVVTQVTCSCGNTFTTRSTAKSGVMHADVCSACHPFYTGKQKIMDVGGRVDSSRSATASASATPSYAQRRLLHRTAPRPHLRVRPRAPFRRAADAADGRRTRRRRR